MTIDLFFSNSVSHSYTNGGIKNTTTTPIQPVLGIIHTQTHSYNGLVIMCRLSFLKQFSNSTEQIGSSLMGVNWLVNKPSKDYLTHVEGKI